ncbi:unnamed protein product [Victoria cruziana]
MGYKVTTSEDRTGKVAFVEGSFSQVCNGQTHVDVREPGLPFLQVLRISSWLFLLFSPLLASVGMFCLDIWGQAAQCSTASNLQNAG